MGIPIGANLNQGVYHPETHHISNPPPPPAQTPAAALAEHVAIQSGQTPAQVAAPPMAAELEPTYPSGPAGLASWQNSQVNPLYSVINRYLRKKGSPLAGKGQVFVNQGKAAGVDPRLLVAITGAETSFMTDPNAAPASEHNAFGMGPGIQYPNWRSGIRAAAQNLGQNYIGEGLDTIKEISGKWAPIGAANDSASNVNPNWAGNVSKFYNELGGMRPGMGSIPKWAGGQELIYDPRGSWFRGQDGVQPGAYGGHETHIHFAASNPRALLKAYNKGTNHGLSFTENPYTSGVNPVHAGTSAQYGDTSGGGSPSWHYQTFPGTFGPDNRRLGEAFDINDPNPNSGWDLNRMFSFLAPRVTGSPDFNYGSTGGGGYDITGTATPQQAQNVAARDAQSNSLLGGSLASYEGAPGIGRRRKRSSSVDDLIANLQMIQAGGGYLGA